MDDIRRLVESAIVAATAACWASSAVKPGSRGTTIGFTIHYLAPAHTERKS